METGMPYGSKEQVGHLLLDEVRHRFANEFACALASLQLTKARISVAAPMIDQAIERMGYQIRLQRFMLECCEREAGEAILALSNLLSASRAQPCRFSVKLSGAPIKLEDALMRILLISAYELLNNAVKHAHDDSESIRVRLARRGTRLVLTVANLTRSQHVSSETRGGAGTEIIRKLLRPIDGRVVMRENHEAFIAQVRIPL